ncbi:MAG: extracellular solute-binding protein, partial [Chloroflexota bacterium]
MRLTRRQFGVMMLGGSSAFLLSACGGSTSEPAKPTTAPAAPKPTSAPAATKPAAASSPSTAASPAAVSSPSASPAAVSSPAASPMASPAAAAPASKPSSSTAAASGTVSFITALAEEERKVVGDLLKQFQSNSGVEVKMVQMESQDVVNQLKAKKTANRMDVDLIAQDNLRLGPLVRDGIVEDLSSEQSRVPSTTIEALVPVTQFDGKRYFLPYRPNVQITFYNEPKLQSYSLQPPKTWDDLMKVAQTLKEKEGIGKVAIQGAAGDPLTVTVFEFIKQAGGDPLVLNDAGSVKAFEYLAQLEPFLTPEYRTAKFDTMNTIISNDTAYLGSNWPFGINVIVDTNGRKDVKAYQGWAGPAKESHVLGGEVLGIPVGAPNRAGALAVADFLMSKETQSTLLTKLGWPPMRTDAFGSVPDWQQPYFEAVQNALKHVDARPNVPYWEEVSRAMNDAFRDIVQQKQPAKATLDRYAEMVQKAKQA